MNTQRKISINKSFHPVNHDHVQLLLDSSSHWFLRFCSCGRIQICGSLKSILNRVSMNCVYALYKNVVGEFGKSHPFFCQFINKRMAVTVVSLQLHMLQKYWIENRQWKLFLTSMKCDAIWYFVLSSKNWYHSQNYEEIEELFLKCEQESCVDQNFHFANFLNSNIHFRCDALWWFSKNRFSLIQSRNFL